MKQNITIEQWQELSLGRQKKFHGVSKTGGLPTIGRMIEFLDENHALQTKTEVAPFTPGVAGGAIIEPTYFIEWKYPNELCDSLWEAVKKVLE